jgi:hypothetical protein
MLVEAASEFSGVLFVLYRTSKFFVDGSNETFSNNDKIFCFRYEGIKIYLYTGDNDVTPKQILSKCRNNFNIQIDVNRIDFVFLKQRKWVEAEKYPVLTMLGQSLGSIILGFEALLKFQPDIFLDTMGEIAQYLFPLSLAY